jgi:hypothetical protein
VEIFRFDRSEHLIEQFASVNAHATRVAASEEPIGLTCLTIGPDGIIGAHPAHAVQLFLVVTGAGWVAGPDDHRVPISAGWGVRWEAGETHTSGTATGLTAFTLEGPAVDLIPAE